MDEESYCDEESELNASSKIRQNKTSRDMLITRNILTLQSFIGGKFVLTLMYKVFNRISNLSFGINSLG